VLAIDLLLLVLLWLGFALLTARGPYQVGYDTMRDIAYARGILSGHAWEDPMVAGLRAWYPPGVPAFFAGLSAITGLDVSQLYATSGAWLSWTLPVALFLLARQVWGRATAWLAVPFVVLGSRWWLVHSLVPMSSLQSVPIALASLLVWQRFGRTSWKGAAASAVLLAATLWCHVLCGAMAIGAIVVHEGIEAFLARRDDPPVARRVWRRTGIWAAALGSALGAPPVLAQLRMPRLNEAPHHWFAPELHDPRFALHAGTPLAPLLGLAGLVLATRRWASEGWLVGYVLLATLGCALGYLGHDLHWPVPWALPHEFQWHAQFGLMVAAATAAVRLGRGASRGALAPVVTLLLTTASLGPALLHVRDASSYLLQLDRDYAHVFRMSAWIGQHLPPRSVLVASPEPAYFICALSGTRAILLPAGHLNPAADPVQRAEDLTAMFHAADDSGFAALASRYDAHYLLATVDMAPMHTLRRRFDAWKRLEELYTVDSIAILYHILPEPSAPNRESRGTP
jgi:hypothetical protein